jgi:hypothetical protein
VAAWRGYTRPSRRWQLAHAGGTLPFALHRIAMSHTMPQSALPRDGIPGRRGPFVYARRFYYDTGIPGSKAQLEATKECADMSRIVFGTDWPFTDDFFGSDAAERWPWFTDCPRARIPSPRSPRPSAGASARG